MRRTVRVLTLAGWVLTTTSVGFGLAAEPAATPQRPSFSSDTNTTVPGTLELEAGFFLDDGEGRDVPVFLKWGATGSTEIFVGWSPFLQVEAGDGSESGGGDVTVGTRTRVRDGDDGGPAVALQGTAKLPAGDEAKGLSSGENDVSLAAIATHSFGDVGVVGYAQTAFLGAPGSNVVDVQHALAVALGRSLAGNVAGFAEITVTHAPALDANSSFGIVGLTYSPRPSVVLDGAVLIGLGGDASDQLAGTVGVTVNLGALTR